MELSQSWKETKNLISEARAEARAESEACSRCTFSRGTFYYVLTSNENNDPLITEGECWEVAKTKTQLLIDLASIKKMYPTAHTVHAGAGCDGADSPYEYRRGEYDTWTGESTRLIHTYGE